MVVACFPFPLTLTLSRQGRGKPRETLSGKGRGDIVTKCCLALAPSCDIIIPEQGCGESVS